VEKGIRPAVGQTKQERYSGIGGGRERGRIESYVISFGDYVEREEKVKAQKEKKRERKKLTLSPQEGVTGGFVRVRLRTNSIGGSRPFALAGGARRK